MFQPKNAPPFVAVPKERLSQVAVWQEVTSISTMAGMKEIVLWQKKGDGVAEKGRITGQLFTSEVL